MADANPFAKFAPQAGDTGNPFQAFAPTSEPKPPAQPAMSFSEGVGTGLLDKFYGAAQLGGHITAVPEQSMAPNFGMVPPETQKTVDEAVKKREEGIQRQSGGGWGRTLGSFVGDIGLSAPLSFVPGLGPIMGGALGGAVTGMMEPVTSGNYEATKIGQGVISTGVGAGVGAAAKGVEAAVLSFMRPAEDRVAQQATEAVVRRLNQDAKAGGPTADQALEQVANWQKQGQPVRPSDVIKPMTLADVGGENTKGLAGQVGRQPGASRSTAREFLSNRDEAVSGRLNKDISQFISGEGSAFQTTQALLTARKEAATPLYHQAESLQNVWSPRLQQFLEEPRVKRGLARGMELERLSSLAENRPFDPTALGVDLDQEGNAVLKQVPNLRVLDMGKRGLDAMIADEREPVTGRLSTLGRELENVRRAYVSEIDTLDTSGVYKAARDAWAGPSASLDAVKFGKTVFNRNPEESTASLGAMNANDREFARLGVADVLRERIAKVGFGGNEARAIIKNDWTREQLKPFFKNPQEYDRFVDAVMAEHAMAETTQKVMKGSQTAERAAEDRAGIRPILSGGQLIHSLFSMHPLQALRHAGQLYRDLGRGTDERLNEAVAKLLFSTHPRFFEEAPRQAVAPIAAPVLGGAGGDTATSILGLQ